MALALSAPAGGGPSTSEPGARGVHGLRRHVEYPTLADTVIETQIVIHERQALQAEPEIIEGTGGAELTPVRFGDPQQRFGRATHGTENSQPVLSQTWTAYETSCLRPTRNSTGTAISCATTEN